MNSPKLIILTAAVGSGHVRAAQAVAKALKQLDAHLDVEVIDALDYAPRWFRTLYAGGYEFLVTKWPAAFGLLYRLTNQPVRWAHRPIYALHMWIEGWVVRRLMRMVRDRSATHVLHTHYLLLPHMIRYRWRGFPEMAHAVVVTDFEAHAYWFVEGVDHYFVGADRVADDLVAKGTPAERIAVSGIPVDPVWHDTVDASRVRRDLRLAADQRVVLIVAGSNFTLGPFAAITERLAAALPEAHVIVVAGRNAALQHQLDRIATTHANVTVFGYTKTLHELMAVSDVLISKPGGLITSEALATGTPLVIPAAIPGQETANAAFLEAQNAARMVNTANTANTADETVAIVSDLLNGKDALDAMKAAARSLGKNGAATIAQAVRDWMN